MPTSVRYRLLHKEVLRLRKHLLPKKFDPTGTYSERQRTCAVGFRVLSHAEIESFLEDRALELARTAVVAWKTQGKVGRTTLCLTAFVEEDPPVSLVAVQPTQRRLWPERIDITIRLDVALNKYHARIRENHGLKEENILKLLLPIGVPASSIDPLLVTSLNNFGEQRGVAAHTSAASYMTVSAIDPETEWKAVEDIVAQIKSLDAVLNGLLL